MPVAIKDIDKLDSIIQIRAPQCLKDSIEKDLCAVARKAMNMELLEVIAKHVHMSRLNPHDYLRSD